MKVLLPLTLENYKDFNLVGKTLVYAKGMVEVINDTVYYSKDVSQNVLRVDGKVLEVFLFENKEVYLISEV